jgi:hypothetical protein
MLNPFWENHALWLAMLLFMFACGAIQTFLFKKAILKKGKTWWSYSTNHQNNFIPER